MPIITRRNQALLHHSFYSPYITAILGPRRVGKSTIDSFIIFRYSYQLQKG